MALDSMKKAVTGGIGESIYNFLHGRGEDEAMKKNFKKGDDAKKKGTMKKRPKKPSKKVNRVKRKPKAKTATPKKEEKPMGRVKRKPSKYSKIKRATPTDKDYVFDTKGSIGRRRGEIKSLRDDYHALEDTLRGMGKNPTQDQKVKFSRQKDSYFRKRKETLQSQITGLNREENLLALRRKRKNN